MFEYVKWRGDLSFSASPFGEIDALIFSQLSYLHFRDVLGTEAAPLRAAAKLLEAMPAEPGNAQAVAQRHKLLRAVKRSARFGGLAVGWCEDRFDTARGMQFAAATFALPEGAHALSFRGTDATVVGWREDFNMSFSCPVPSQAEALAYLEAVAAQTAGPLFLCGHSKGGNLALYAAATCAPAVRERIATVWLFDAPGLDAGTVATEGYRAALPKVRCYVPQASLIGRLMNAPEAYTVVHSAAIGFSQHNVFTWELDGPRFVTRPSLDKTSLLMKATMDEFLLESTPETRRLFVETLFSVLGAGNAYTLSDVAGRLADTAGALFTTLRALDPATKKAVLSIAGTLASSGVESARRFIGEYRAESKQTP